MFFEMRFLGDAAQWLSLHKRPVPLCVLAVLCVGAGFGCWGGISQQPCFCTHGVWCSQPGTPAVHGAGLEQTPVPPPQQCHHVRGGVTLCWSSCWSSWGCSSCSSCSFSLSVVRSRVPEAEGEELPVSLWAALHGDAHQGESSALVWGCF